MRGVCDGWLAYLAAGFHRSIAHAKQAGVVIDAAHFGFWLVRLSVGKSYVWPKFGSGLDYFTICEYFHHPLVLGRFWKRRSTHSPVTLRALQPDSAEIWR